MGGLLVGIFLITFWGGVGLCYLGLWGMGLVGIIIGVCVAWLSIKYDEWSLDRLIRSGKKDRPSWITEEKKKERSD